VDDIVLIAKDEEGMRSMLKRLETYLNRKGLDLNRKKTKVLRFKKGRDGKDKLEIERKRAGRGERI